MDDFSHTFAFFVHSYLCICVWLVSSSWTPGPMWREPQCVMGRRAVQILRSSWLQQQVCTRTHYTLAHLPMPWVLRILRSRSLCAALKLIYCWEAKNRLMVSRLQKPDNVLSNRSWLNWVCSVQSGCGCLTCIFTGCGDGVCGLLVLFKVCGNILCRDFGEATHSCMMRNPTVHTRSSYSCLCSTLSKQQLRHLTIPSFLPFVVLALFIYLFTSHLCLPTSLLPMFLFLFLLLLLSFLQGIMRWWVCCWREGLTPCRGPGKETHLLHRFTRTWTALVMLLHTATGTPYWVSTHTHSVYPLDGRKWLHSCTACDV